MNSDRQKILTDYISYIYTTGRTYDTVGKYIKHVTDFLEMAKEVNRRGYLNYKRHGASFANVFSYMRSIILSQHRIWKKGKGGETFGKT